MYTTIIQEARKILKLSQAEYIVADTIYHLSVNPKSNPPGWSGISQEVLAFSLGLSSRTISKILKKLKEKDILNIMGNLKQTTRVWYDTVILFDFKINNSWTNLICEYCGKSILEVPLELDHKEPYSESKNNTKENLTLACPSCNKEKGVIRYKEYKKLKWMDG